jgi:predicted ATPase/class 3 adenylate cyclase
MRPLGQSTGRPFIPPAVRSEEFPLLTRNCSHSDRTRWSLHVDLPTGTVTFLFTDIEGSTRLWEAHPDSMRSAVERHDALLRATIEAHDGHVFKTVGDAFCAVFTRPSNAVAAAVDVQREIAAQFGDSVAAHETDVGAATDSTENGDAVVLRVRIALHTGTADERDRDYFGPPVNRVARLLGIAHGGQIILSDVTRRTLAGGLPAGIALKDLGQHRLKDLLEAEPVQQVTHDDLRSSFPPLRSLQLFRHNLPCQLTSYIGREKEVADVERLLSSARLVTLIGAGGMGKTRLSLQVAANVIEDYPDGVWLVELAALTEPALVPATVAACLQVSEEPGRPVVGTLVDALKAKKMLIVLDNCEHVIDSAAQLVTAILRACPDGRVLATSREALRVSGEHTYGVPSLDIPDSSRLNRRRDPADYEAVRLFRDRAQAVDARFVITEDNAESVVQVCRRLDGIPLAIELAAARVRSLPVEHIATRLDDRFRLLTGGSRTALPRQQTLRALIDWSWDLLAPREQALLRRLAVFAGGFTIEACEAVCADGDISVRQEPIDAFDVMDLLSELIEKSLLIMEDRVGGLRYRLLETVRQYGRERLQESGEENAVRRRHFAWFLALAREAEPHFDGPEIQEWLNRLELEHDNMRGALLFVREGENPVRMTVALHRFWFVRGYLTEGREWLESALRGAGECDPMLRAKALNCVGILAWRQGDFAAARPSFAASLDLRLSGGDRSGAAAALNNLGLLADDEGDHAAARGYYEEAAQIYRELGDRAHVGMVLANLGGNFVYQGDLTAGASTLEKCLTVAEETGDVWLATSARNNLAEIAFRQGEHHRASALFRRSLDTAAELGDRTEIARILLSLGQIALAEGHADQALELLLLSDRLVSLIGASLSPDEAEAAARAQEKARSELSGDVYATILTSAASRNTDASDIASYVTGLWPE